MADELCETFPLCQGLNPAWLQKWISTKSVHVFIGTHIEAVAGECLLPDVPPAG